MLANLPKATKENPNAIFNAIADEEWNRWRLIMAEDCTLTFKDLFDRPMEELDVNVANCALNRMIREKNRANKGKN